MTGEWTLEELAKRAQLGIGFGRNGRGALRQRGEGTILRRLQAGRERRRRAAEPAQERGEHRAGEAGSGGGGTDLALELALAGIGRDLYLGQDARRESAHHRAAIAQKARGEAVAVREMGEKVVARKPGKLLVLGKEPRDALCRGRIAREQRTHFRGEISLPRESRPELFFGGRGRRIHQAQQRMVLAGIELQRRRRQEQQAPGARRQRLRHLVRAGPAQMVGLVDDDEIPAHLGSLAGLVLRPGEPFERGDDQRVLAPHRR